MMSPSPQTSIHKSCLKLKLYQFQEKVNKPSKSNLNMKCDLTNEHCLILSLYM